MVNESNKTIFKSLFINLALSPVTTMKNLDFSVILQQRRLCSFKNQCHKHVLFNVCTAFVTFLCRKNTLQHLEHPSLKVIDDFRWSSIIGVQDYILNTFVFLEFRIIIGVQDYILNTFDFVEFRIIGV